MSFMIYIKDDKTPHLTRTIGLPDVKSQGVLENDSDALNAARAIFATWEQITPTTYYRHLGKHKFYFDAEEKNTAMKQIMDDFILHGEYEPNTTELFREHIKEGDTCVDVGASIGYFTLLMAELTGNTGHVISLEPTKNQYPYLIKNIEANQYSHIVDAYNLGAWSENTEIRGKINLGHEGNMKVITLDSLLSDPIPKKVDFIKIDTDGAEPEILKGLEQTVINNPQLKLIIEFYPKYIENLNLNPQDVIDFLDKHFTYSKIEGDYTSEYYNFFCVRK